MLKKTLYAFLGVYILYIFLGFFILPFVIQSQATNYVKEQLNKDLTVQEVKFNPFLFKLNINNVVLKDEKSTLISFENLHLDFDLDRTIANKYLHFKNLLLIKPLVNIEINKNKELNLLSLIPPSSNEVEKKRTSIELLKLQLDTLSIEDGTFNFKDDSLQQPFQTSLKNFNYIFRDINTLKNSVAAQTLSTIFNDETKLYFKGGLSLNPLKTYGNIEIDNLKTNTFWSLIKEQYPITVDENLFLNSKIAFVLHLEDEPTLILNDTLIDVHNFHIKDKKSETLLSLNKLTLQDLNFKFPQTPKTKLLESSFELLINEGKLQTHSLVNLEPLDAKVDLTLENLPLDILNPILHQNTFIDIKSAFLNTQANIQYVNSSLKAQANSSLDNLNIIHNTKPLIASKSILAQGIVFDQKENLLSIKQVKASKPYVFVQVNEKSELNLMQLIKPSKEETATSSSKESSKPLNLNFGPLSIENGKMTFEDLTLPIHLKLENHNINGSLSQFNSNSTKPSVVKLNGNIGKYGNMNIAGDLVHSDFKSYTDLKIDFDNIALKDLSGYSGKFVGQTIEDGKLMLNLSYYIEKSKLDAKNNLVISKIKLGDKIQSEEAMSLPLSLAIAILEDSNGKIDIKLPVNGNLDSPEFSVAPIIWQAFTNLITKAITAPFSLLGSLFGFGENEINSVPFYFGNAEITGVQKESLDKIAQILQSRSKLAIQYGLVYDQKNDLEALQSIQFQNKMQEKFKNTKPESYQKEYLDYLETTYEEFDGNLDELQQKHTLEKVLNERNYKIAMEAFLASKEHIEPSILESLAKNRALNVQNYLMQQKIPKEQIVILDKIETKTKEDKFAILELKVDNVD